MKKFIIYTILLLLVFTGKAQLGRPAAIGTKVIANGTSPIAKFALRTNTTTISGFSVLPASGFPSDPVATVSVTFPGSGVVLTGNPVNIDPVFGAFWSSNTDGANSGTFTSLFPAAAVAGTWLSTRTYNISTPPLVVSSIPVVGGNTVVKVLSSQRSAVDPSVQNISIYVQFGSATPTSQLLNVRDNSQFFVTFTGTITSGETIKIWFVPAAGGSGFAQINCIAIEQ